MFPLCYGHADDIDTLTYIYDHSGMLGVLHNGEVFKYVRNIFGDITHICSSTNSMLAKYVYDAWGNCKVCNPDGTENTSSTFIGNINPFRYRGYYYDVETGLYYLQSRYYDPETGRFINADTIDYLDPESINGLNLYAYCNNNPVMYLKGGVSFDGLGTIDCGNSTQKYNPVPEWLKIGVGAIPAVILAAQYLHAKGIHGKFVYSTNTLYMFPKLGAYWARFKIAKNGYGKIVGASFKQIATGNARAGFGAITKSLGKTAALTGWINFCCNFYENNCQIDEAMLMDTAIDTGIGLASYGLAVGTMSLAVAGLAMLGLAIPGVAVVVGIIGLNIFFDWLLREITGYKD